jgi:DNA transformation protein
VDREGLEELFSPFAVVSVRRMFGGNGVYFDGLCFALDLGGEVYLKADAETEPDFVAAGSHPFVYQARGRTVKVAYWRLVDSAYDDEDELRRWAELALLAARRAAAAKAKRPAAAKLKTAKRPSRPAQAGGAPAARRPRR